MKTKKEYAYILIWAKKIKAINLLGGECEKCGEKRPWVLSFHHKNPNKKEFNISKHYQKRWSLLKIEVKKCILLCSNCHMELHNSIINKETRYDKSKKIILDFKNINSCQKCKYNKCKRALDFHHIKDKEFKLNGGTIKIGENSCEEVKNKIIKEINKCKVLCANCHQDLHFDKKRFEKYKDEINKWEYKERPEEVNKDLVIKMYKDGKKQIEISRELNCAKSTICGIIKKYNARVAEW